MNAKWGEGAGASDGLPHDDATRASASRSGSMRSNRPAQGSDGRPPALSVSGAMNIAKSLLSQHAFRIEGEISDLSDKPGYKAVYFTIKDPDASLPCMMWKNRHAASGLQLRVGMKVLVTGKFTIFAPKGRMNFDVSQIALAGEGDLRAQVARLAERLEAEGLMAPARKRPLPRFPERIGLVTSPRGAAVHDVLRTLRRHYPQGKVLLAGVPVEGKGAPAGIIAGMDAVVAAGAQVVLVVRGGGSFEDLMPFNDESLARAIAACPVPVVTGIGHEPDNSIADMVSDLRASTPTGAAKEAVPDNDELAAALDRARGRMGSAMEARLVRDAERLGSLSSRAMFRDPLLLFSNDLQLLDVYHAGLERSLRMALDGAADRLGQLARRLATAGGASTERSRDRVLESQRQLMGIGARLTQRYESELRLAAAQLNDFSPVKTLARGWSIAQDATGAVVKSVDQAPPGSEVTVTVSDGVLFAHVMETKKAANE